MGTATLTVDLDALAMNWRALNRRVARSSAMAACVKADGYGLGVARVVRTLWRAGARTFFVAQAEEGRAIREELGPAPEVCVFSGHMEGDAPLLRRDKLTPMLNSVDQLLRHVEAMPDHPFGIQLDTGMNRLGLEPVEWQAVRDIAMAAGPRLVMSHLACADEPKHPMNERQLALFREMTDGLDVPRSLAATGGVLLGQDWHFDLCRPGIGLYGGRPFETAKPVVRLSVPVIQVRDVDPGETVGYGASWTAKRKTRLATVQAGYADGLIRAMGGKAVLYAGRTACPLAGRVSMDMLTVDVTDAKDTPDALDILGPEQGVDDLADAAGTIGYEILTSLGARYARVYTGGLE